MAAVTYRFLNRGGGGRGGLSGYIHIKSKNRGGGGGGGAQARVVIPPCMKHCMGTIGVESEV